MFFCRHHRIALLIFLLIFLQQESLAPYYATAALLVLNQFSPQHRLDLSGAVDLMYSVGKFSLSLWSCWRE